MILLIWPLLQRNLNFHPAAKHRAEAIVVIMICFSSFQWLLCSISRLEIRVRKANDNTLSSIKLVIHLTPAAERKDTGLLSRTAEAGKPLGDHHTTAHETDLLTLGARAQQQSLVDSLSHPQTTLFSRFLASTIKYPSHAREVSQPSMYSSASWLVSMRPRSNFWRHRTPNISHYLHQNTSYPPSRETIS